MSTEFGRSSLFCGRVVGAKGTRKRPPIRTHPPLPLPISNVLDGRDRSGCGVVGGPLRVSFVPTTRLCKNLMLPFQICPLLVGAFPLYHSYARE